MIFDLMKNFGHYGHLAPEEWQKVELFLAGCSADTAIGRHDIEGDGIYALIQEYETHLPDPKKLEIHKRYVDIQLLLAGEEIIVYRDVDKLEGSVEYNDAKDIAFFHHCEEEAVPMVLKPGNFAVFFPGEGHMPGLHPKGRPHKVRKVVIKILESLFLRP